MIHVRTAIRNAAASAVTGLLTTGVRVYKSRNIPLSANEYPCLCVYVRSDVPDYGEGASFSGGRSIPVRRLGLHVEGYVKDSENEAIETLLDQIAAEVETALFATILEGSLGISLGDQILSTDASGEETLGIIDMSFQVLYRTVEGAPEISV